MWSLCSVPARNKKLKNTYETNHDDFIPTQRNFAQRFIKNYYINELTFHYEFRIKFLLLFYFDILKLYAYNLRSPS